MVRFTSDDPNGLDQDQLRVYAAIVCGPRSAVPTAPVVDRDGRLTGPFALMTISPAIGMAVQQVGAAIRFDGSLPPMLRETAILTVAAHYSCDFEWYSHRDLAAEAGIGAHDLESIRTKSADTLPTPLEQVRSLVNTLILEGGIDHSAYEGAISLLGLEGLAELVWITGYYSMLALALGTFEPEVPSDVPGQFMNR